MHDPEPSAETGATDRAYGELVGLLQNANPLVFDGLTATVFNEALIEFQAGRVVAMADPPGNPRVTADELRRAGRRQLAALGLPPEMAR